MGKLVYISVSRTQHEVSQHLLTMARRMGPLQPRGGETSLRFLAGIVAAASMHRINAQGFGTSVEPCPNAPDVTGYSTVDALNSDMMAELEKIRAGGPPVEPYMFELCPNTIFNTSATPLIPLLSGSVFSCGSAAAPGTGCDITGGDTQVLIDDPADVPGYDLQMVSFVGISFMGFTGAAIGGGAGSNTTVDILNAKFAVGYTCMNRFCFQPLGFQHLTCFLLFPFTGFQCNVCCKSATPRWSKTFQSAGQ